MLPMNIFHVQIQISDFLLLVIGCGLFIMMICISILSLLEKENTASKRSLLAAFLLSSPYFILLNLDFNNKSIIAYALAGCTILAAFLILMPIPVKFRKFDEKIKQKYDERDVVFVRKRLEEGSERFKEYYAGKPEKLEPDNLFRSAPGLLSPQSGQADPFMYASTEASFIACENLIDICDGPVNKEQIKPDSKDISEYIKNWTKLLGARSVGITLLKDDHKYSIGGRGDKYGEPVLNNHKYAIAFTVEMDHDSIRKGPQAPAVMESAKQYLNAGTIAVQLASFIRSLGYSARAHIDAHYEVICPLVGRDAGLGELGRMGILMTHELGPRARVNVVTTELPLEIDVRKYDGSMIEFCRHCKKCAEVCPGKAISDNDRELHNGVLCWKINHEKCFNYWCNSGTDCGRCMATCPYSHPDTIMHNVVRFFIKYSPVFRRLAATMDDLLYGRKPRPMKLDKWQKVGFRQTME